MVDQNLIKDWVTTDENGNAVLDEAKVKAYVVELAKKYDTFGYPRQFKTSTGETITVSGGDYGWLMARNDTTTKLIEAIKSGKSQTIEPEYTYKGYVRDTNDIGNTYVEVIFHPDFTVGLGISPNHALRLVGYTTGRELHPALKNNYLISLR